MNNELLLLNNEMRPSGSKVIPETHKAKMGKEPKKTIETNYVHRGYHDHVVVEDVVVAATIAPTAKETTMVVEVVGTMAAIEVAKYSNRNKRLSLLAIDVEWGTSGLWAKICRTPKHRCDLYKESEEGKNPKTPFGI